MADAPDSKSGEGQLSWGFKSPLRHHDFNTLPLPTIPSLINSLLLSYRNRSYRRSIPRFPAAPPSPPTEPHETEQNGRNAWWSECLTCCPFGLFKTPYENLRPLLSHWPSGLRSVDCRDCTRPPRHSFVLVVILGNGHWELVEFGDEEIDRVFYLDNRRLPDYLYYEVWLVEPFKQSDIFLNTDKPVHLHLLTHTLPWIAVLIYEDRRETGERTGIL